MGAPAAAQPGSSQDAGGRARTILADPRYQTDLPKHAASPEVPEPSQSPAWQPPSVPSAVVPAIGAGAFLAQMVFIVLLVVVAVLLLGWLGRALWNWNSRGRPGAVAGEAVEAGGPAAPERDPELEDASRLAAEGRYGEAIHALLLAAIHHFAARARMQVPPSRTSRELARLLPLGVESRTAFNELVRSVELYLFGGVAAGPEDYESSLARFRSLVRRPA